MINIPGQLAIRTINGRNGEFNVGKLSTSIGEFVIKDASWTSTSKESTAVILRERVKPPSPEHAADNKPWLYCDWQARQTAYRLLQHLERATR